MSELRFANRAEAIRCIFDHGDVAGRNAGIAYPLGDREDHEEQDEERGEAEQRKAL